MIRSLHPRAILAASLAALFAPALWALPSQYHVTYLGKDVQGNRLNASGQVAGVDRSGGKGSFVPAVWSSGIVFHLADTGYKGGAAFAINDSGVVGGDLNGKGFDHAAFWPEADQFVDLGGLFQSKTSFVLGINNQGDCAMTAIVHDGSEFGQRTFFARGCTNPQNIGQIGGNYTFVERINNNDQMAGYSQLNTSQTLQRAYIWTNGTMKLIGVCRDLTSSGALGLNDSGHAVGFCSTGDGTPLSGFYYDGAEMIRIGTLGGKQSVAFAINNADVIVGWSQTAAKAKHAFILDRGAGPHKLHDLQTMLDSSGNGWVFDQGVDINDAGQILAHGTFQGLKNQYAILTPAD
jgi:probable HAF family extracellular repeat protein